MICILEDNEDRVRRFRAAAAIVAPELEIRIWRNAQEMLAELVGILEEVKIISLDHDLNRMPQDLDDPGSGYDVAKVLGELHPFCPIIIHTSNSERGTWMEGELARAGWRYERVLPFGEDWIETEWAAVVRRILGQK